MLTSDNQQCCSVFVNTLKNLTKNLAVCISRGRPGSVSSVTVLIGSVDAAPRQQANDGHKSPTRGTEGTSQSF